MSLLCVSQIFSSRKEEFTRNCNFRNSRTFFVAIGPSCPEWKVEWKGERMEFELESEWTAEGW